jgi:hypothetical protein
MKINIFTFALFCFACTNLFSQNFAGKRIYNGNLTLNLIGGSTSTQASQSVLSFNSTFLTGKIRENDTYTAFGFNFGINSTVDSRQSVAGIPNENTYSSYSLGPAIQAGKFVKVFDKFYFAPNTSIGVSYIFGSSESPTTSNSIGGFNGRINVSALNFVYQIQNNLLLSMNLGGFGIAYNYVGLTPQSKGTGGPVVNATNRVNNYDLSVYGSITNFSGIGAYYLF